MNPINDNKLYWRHRFISFHLPEARHKNDMHISVNINKYIESDEQNEKPFYKTNTQKQKIRYCYICMLKMNENERREKMEKHNESIKPVN